MLAFVFRMAFSLAAGLAFTFGARSCRGFLLGCLLDLLGRGFERTTRGGEFIADGVKCVKLRRSR